MEAWVRAAFALAVGGCVAATPDGTPSTDRVAERQATRSIWAVVPDAPRRKADLQPALIRGAAVAIAPDRLIAFCTATGGRARVGLVRHNKYRLATVEPDQTGQLCRLNVENGPLNPALGYRTFADVRVGEPVTALASATASEVTLSRGWLAGKGTADDPFLETTAAPPDTASVVLIDGAGNLIGLGGAGPTSDATLVAVPVTPELVAGLANHDLGIFGPLLAGTVSDPRARPPQPSVRILLAQDRDGADRTAFGRFSTAASGTDDATATRGGTARPNRPPGTGSGGGGPAPTGPAPASPPSERPVGNVAGPATGTPTADRADRRRERGDADDDRRGRGRGRDVSDDDRDRSGRGGRGRSGRDREDDD